MDPDADRGGPKTYGPYGYGSGSATFDSLDRYTFFSSRSFFPAAAAVSLVVAVAAAAEPLLTPLPLHKRRVQILLQSPYQFSHLFIVRTFPFFLKAHPIDFVLLSWSRTWTKYL
jgi:hypothetical protein